MERFIYCTCFLLIINSYNICAQNLVPNWSLEIQDSCPYKQGQLSFATGWINPQTDTVGDPDYYNSCGTIPFGTPYNFLGNQYPKDGNAYFGLICFLRVLNFPNFREYAEINLLQNLIAGEQYYLEINVSVAENSGYAQNRIGMAFSDTLYINPTYEYFSIPIALEYMSSPIIDTANWTKISGLYTAIGTEQFLLLGCFKPDSLLVLDSVNVGSVGSVSSYYYFDDIKVIPLDSLQGIDEPIINLSVNVYPNPAKEWLTIDFGSNIQNQLNASLFSVDGKEIKNWSEKYTSKMYLNLPQLSNGIFTIENSFKNSQITYVELFDQVGRKLNAPKITASTKNFIINLENYPSGVYILKLFLSDGSQLNRSIIIVKP